MTVHRVARQGFGSEADTYERSRPSYPPDAVEWLVRNLRLGPGVRAIDLAAGTGKLTRLLLASEADLIAVEPVEGMRATFSTVLPDNPLVAGAAEALPFSGGSLEAVTVAQAFHWFDADAAFAELARVLRPGGRLGIIWNGRDRSVPWVDAVWSIMDRVEKEAPWRDHDSWRASAFGERPGFGAMHEAVFHHEQLLTHEGVVERFRGVSHVASLPPREQAAVLDEVREVIRTRPDTRDRELLSLPYRVDAYWTERR